MVILRLNSGTHAWSLINNYLTIVLDFLFSFFLFTSHTELAFTFLAWTQIARSYTLKKVFRARNYSYHILFPRSLKTSNSSVFMTKFNMMYVFIIAFRGF